MDIHNTVTVADFRKSTKVVFDTARDKPIHIRRGGEVFELRLVGSTVIVPIQEKVVESPSAPVSYHLTNVGSEPSVKMASHKPEGEFVTVDWNEAGNGERACCKEAKPCKHWTWDINSGEGYRNSLSGRLREE